MLYIADVAGAESGRGDRDDASQLRRNETKKLLQAILVPDQRSSSAMLVVCVTLTFQQALARGWNLGYLVVGLRLLRLLDPLM